MTAIRADIVNNYQNLDKSNQIPSERNKNNDAKSSGAKRGETTSVFLLPVDKYEETKLDHKADSASGDQTRQQGMTIQVPAEAGDYKSKESQEEVVRQDARYYERNDDSITDQATQFSENASEKTNEHYLSLGERRAKEAENRFETAARKKDSRQETVEHQPRPHPKITSEKKHDEDQVRPLRDASSASQNEKIAADQANDAQRSLADRKQLQLDEQTKSEHLERASKSQDTRKELVGDADHDDLAAARDRSQNIQHQVDLRSKRAEGVDHEVAESASRRDSLIASDDLASRRVRQSQAKLLEDIQPSEASKDEPQSGVFELMAALDRGSQIETESGEATQNGSDFVAQLQSEGIFGVTANGRNASAADFLKKKQFEYQMEQKRLTHDDFLIETEKAIFDTISSYRSSDLAKTLLHAAESINGYRNHLSVLSELPKANQPAIR